MINPYIPVVRKANVLGCNIRPGSMPGGFTHPFSTNKPRIRRSHKGSIDSRMICEAANRVLEKRGLINDPNLQDSTMHGGFSG